MSARKPSAAAPRTVRDFVLWAERHFTQAGLHFGHGTDNARDEAAWLTASALAIPFGQLDASAERLLTETEIANLRSLVEARVNIRKPLAYLLNEAWFAGLRFYVDERVIVPRSLLGELLPNRFQPDVEPARVRRILDLCTGSGCIAVAAAHYFPRARVDAADISADALAVARRNVEDHHLKDRVELVQSDLFANLRDRRYDLILTNPPYVDADDMAGLPQEYRHEPTLALAAGESGLDAILKILAAAPGHLNPGGVLIAEVGNSCEPLQQRFSEVPFLWLTSASGDDSVFLLTRDELVQYAPRFRGG